MSEEFELTARKWRHRRMMAYTSLWSVIGLVLLVIILAATGKTGTLSEFNSILVMTIGGLISIVGAYFGFSTWYDKS